MSELISEMKVVFEYFNNGDYLFFVIFLLSTIYILTTEKNTNVKKFFGWYSFIILIVIFNPICFKILNKFINYSSMYRIYYMLPLTLEIAYAFTKIIINANGTIKKIFALVAIVGIIVYFGNDITDGTTTEVLNMYKLPDESVQVAEIIYQDNELTYKKAIVPYAISSHIRQIHPEISLYYTRVTGRLYDENGNEMPTDTDSTYTYEPAVKIEEGDVEYIIKLCESSKVNYVVFNSSTVLTANMEDYGFELYEQTENYDIYRSFEITE